MIGFYDGTCPVCGGHIHAHLVNSSGKPACERSPWTCDLCGATENKPEFDPNMPINWRVACFHKTCEKKIDHECLVCSRYAEFDCPGITINGKPVNVKKTLSEKPTYADLTNSGKDTVRVRYLTWIATITFNFDGANWRITSDDGDDFANDTDYTDIAAAHC